MDEFGRVPNIVLTLWRDILSKPGVRFRFDWKSCQWDSIDGTEAELFELFKREGTPGSLTVERL